MTVAETLREWAAGADEEMAGPLRELADQYDAEFNDLERHYLAPVAELLIDRCKVNCAAESFSVLEGLGVVAARIEAFEAAEAARREKIKVGKAVLAEKKANRLAALEQLVQCLITLREVDTKSPDDDLERAAYDRHIADLRAAYGRNHQERD